MLTYESYCFANNCILIVSRLLFGSSGEKSLTNFVCSYKKQRNIQIIMQNYQGDVLNVKKEVFFPLFNLIILLLSVFEESRFQADISLC